MSAVRNDAYRAVPQIETEQVTSSVISMDADSRDRIASTTVYID